MNCFCNSDSEAEEDFVKQRGYIQKLRTERVEGP